MEAQDDDTPWTSSKDSEGDSGVLLGRGSFDKLGSVRRKPGKSHENDCCID